MPSQLWATLKEQGPSARMIGRAVGLQRRNAGLLAESVERIELELSPVSLQHRWRWRPTRAKGHASLGHWLRFSAAACASGDQNENCCKIRQPDLEF